MEQDMEDIECQTIYKETLEEEPPADILHNRKRPVILKVCMYLKITLS